MSRKLTRYKNCFYGTLFLWGCCLFTPVTTLGAQEQTKQYALAVGAGETLPVVKDIDFSKELLKLRIRFGEDATFAMSFSEHKSPGTSADVSEDLCSFPDASIRLKRFHFLDGCPLPSSYKNIEALQSKLAAMTESWSGEWSIYIKNLTTGDTILLNDMPMKSASVMKLFILGTVYEKLEDGTLERTDTVWDLMTRMICDSSNEASNRLLLLLGDNSYEKGILQVNAYIRENGYGPDTHEYNGFEDSAAICDSAHFNQITARDCGLLLERVYRREFGSRSVCNEVEELMLKQNTRYKIPAGMPDGTLVGNKTGEMDTVENDAAIIYADDCDYILCVLSQDWDSKNDAIEHIRDVSSCVYEFFTDPAYLNGQEEDSYTLLARLLKEEAALAEYPGENDETLAEYREEDVSYRIVSDEGETASSENEVFSDDEETIAPEGYSKASSKNNKTSTKKSSGNTSPKNYINDSNVSGSTSDTQKAGIAKERPGSNDGYTPDIDSTGKKDEYHSEETEITTEETDTREIDPHRETIPENTISGELPALFQDAFPFLNEAGKPSGLH